MVTSFELAEEAYYGISAVCASKPSSLTRNHGALAFTNAMSPTQFAFLGVLIAASLAYLWMIYLGVHAHLNNMVSIIHRTDRCDLSLFQLGLTLLQHLLDESMSIYVDFRLHRGFLLA